MKVQACTNDAEVAKSCADIVAEVLREKPESVLLLPAGATPIRLFEELVWRSREQGLDLSGAHLFQLDEIVGVGPDHEASFHRLLRDHLIEPLGHPAERTHLIDGMAPGPTGVIEKHAEALAALGGADLAILGIGLNGHIAFNEPGSTLKSPSKLVQLSPATLGVLRPGFPEGRVPKFGITLGLREIWAGRRLCLMATGESKADVLFSMLTETPSPQLPASLLRDHVNLTVFADAPARTRFQHSN